MKYSTIFLVVLVVIFISACEILNEPNADAVFKSITKTYQLNKDGSITYSYTHKLKYLTHYSFNRAYGETFIVYNPEYQEIKINRVETTMKNGKKVASPENAFNEVLPRFASGAPDFNHLREMVITHTGLEVGCVVDLDYEIITKPGYYPFLNENIILPERTPVKELVIIVKIPMEKKLRISLFNSKVRPKISNINNVEIYTWKFSDIKPISNERNQALDKAHIPRLIFSTKKILEAFQQLIFDDSLSAEMIEIAISRTLNKKSDIEKVLVLRNMLANEIKTFNIPLKHTGFKTRNLIDVWKSNGATKLEKTLLLSQLINSINLKAEPIFTYPNTLYDRMVGNIIDVGYSLVRVKVNNEDILINANSGKQKINARYVHLNDIILNSRGQAIRLSEVLAPEENSITFLSELKLDDEAVISGNINCEIIGYANPYFEFLEDEKYAKKIIASFIPEKSISVYELLDLNEFSSKITSAFSSDELCRKQGNYVFINLPESKNGLSATHLDVLTEKRYTPIELNALVNESYNYIIELPEGYELVTQYIDTAITNSIGKLEIRILYSYNSIEINRSISIPTKIVEPEFYNDFKNLILLWNKNNFKEIIVKKKITI